MVSQSFCPKAVISLSFCPKVVITLSFCPKVAISLSFRGGWWCPLWWVPGLGSPGGSPWGPLTPWRWWQYPDMSSLWPHPAKCDWCTLWPQQIQLPLPVAGVPGVPWKQLPVIGLSTGRPSPSRSLEVVPLPVQFPEAQLAMWTLALSLQSTDALLPLGVEPSFPQNPSCEASVLTPGGLEGSVQQQ